MSMHIQLHAKKVGIMDYACACPFNKFYSVSMHVDLYFLALEHLLCAATSGYSVN
jgi:hypothetical protein